MDTFSRSYIYKYTADRYNQMEIQRDGRLTEEDRAWNLCHGPRTYYLLKAMLTYVQKKNPDHLNVLNMSGLNEGKPDPVLLELLATQYDRSKITWTVLDHPESLTFTDPNIRQWTDACGIHCIPQDHRKNGGPPKTPPADIVLCTEIIKHLDYSDMIALMRSCWAALKPGGMLICTTPNILFLGYRVLFALGRWDSLHFQDGPKYVDQGQVGHTIYYDAKRLSRLLGLLDYTDIEATTFNAGHGPAEYRNLLRRASAITLRTLSNLVPSSRQVLLVLASKPL
jgi:SAM-dependent methyltransferase